MPPIDQPGRRRRPTGGIINTACYVIDILLSMDPPPFRLLLILAALILCLPWPWQSSSKVDDQNGGLGPAVTTGMRGWLLPATPIALVFLLHCFSTTWLIAAVTPKSWLPCWLSSEGISPWAVAALILQLVFMAQYRPSFHERRPLY